MPQPHGHLGETLVQRTVGEPDHEHGEERHRQGRERRARNQGLEEPFAAQHACADHGREDRCRQVQPPQRGLERQHDVDGQQQRRTHGQTEGGRERQPGSQRYSAPERDRRPEAEQREEHTLLDEQFDEHLERRFRWVDYSRNVGQLRWRRKRRPASAARRSGSVTRQLTDCFISPMTRSIRCASSVSSGMRPPSGAGTPSRPKRATS